MTPAAQETHALMTRCERLVDAHRLQPALISMPGVGVRNAARLLAEISQECSSLTTGPWGIRPLFFRAPDGTVLNIAQHRDPRRKGTGVCRGEKRTDAVLFGYQTAPRVAHSANCAR